MNLENFNEIEKAFWKRRAPIIGTLINIFKKADENLLVIRDSFYNEQNKKYQEKGIELEKDCDYNCIYCEEDRLIIEECLDDWFIAERINVKKEKKVIFYIDFCFEFKSGYYIEIGIWDVKKKSIKEQIKEDILENLFNKIKNKLKLHCNIIEEEKAYSLRVVTKFDINEFREKVGEIQAIINDFLKLI